MNIKRLRNLKTLLSILAGPVKLRKKIRVLDFLYWGRRKEDEGYRFLLVGASFEVANSCTCRKIEKLTLNSLLQQPFASLLFPQAGNLEIQTQKMLSETFKR